MAGRACGLSCAAARRCVELHGWFVGVLVCLTWQTLDLSLLVNAAVSAHPPVCDAPGSSMLLQA